MNHKEQDIKHTDTYINHTATEKWEFALQKRLKQCSPSLHRNYLKDYKGGLYSYLTLTGELWTYLADLNEQCVEYRDFLMNQIMEQEGITEELKSRGVQKVCFLTISIGQGY